MEHAVFFDQLINTQQRALDAALLYQVLGRKAEIPKDADVFHSVSARILHHASLLRSMTGEELRPKKWKSLMIPFLFSALGRKRVIPLLAMGRYLEHQRCEILGRRYKILKQICSEEKKLGQNIAALMY
jgi:hypothetical protein